MKALSRPIFGSAAMRRRRVEVGILGLFPVGLGVFFSFFFAFWSCLAVGILLYTDKRFSRGIVNEE